MFAKTEDNPEQLKIIRQLKELFFTTPEWQLRQLCISNNWDMELCVNQLMNIVPRTSAGVEQKSEQINQPNCANMKSSQKEIVELSEQEQQVGHLVKKGYRVMVLMRGLPGVGKTHSARAIVKNFVDLQPPMQVEDFIFSSDDYFINAKGAYKYNVKFLSYAHDYNQNRVREKAVSGFSPIIVDNTNLKLWEMMPYVKYAVQNGYLIEIVEPKPSWNKCAYKLSQRNIHGVPADKIRHMMEKYEKGNVSDLIKMLKNTKYTVSLPQIRLLPPIVVEPTIPLSFNDEKGESDSMEVPGNDFTALPVDQDTSSWGTYNTGAPKGQRKKLKPGLSPTKITTDILHNDEVPQNQKEQQRPDGKQSPVMSSSARDVYSLLEQKLSNVWKPYEAESIDFWGTDQPKPQPLPSLPADDNISKKPTGQMSLLDLLREDPHDNNNHKTGETSNQKEDEQETCPTVSFDRHSIGCINENVAFVTLRQIYPNKQVSGLWDLFLKCNGDIDWAVDILLKEDELSKLRSDTDFYTNGNDIDSFMCSCNSKPNAYGSEDISAHKKNNMEKFDTNVDSVNTNEIRLPQRHQRPRYSRSNQVFDPTLLEVKENIENCFVLGDDHYSKHLLKIRNFRSGIASGAAASSVTTTVESGDNAENQTVNQDDDEDDDDVGEDMLEMSLGEHLVQQLLDNFRNESSLEERIPPSLPLNLNVFIPRSLAKQLYMLWMESAYNHLEEERQKMVREDEEFARLLKHPKYSEYKQSPSNFGCNLREMLDIEYAWTLYKRDKEELDQERSEMDKLLQPRDLAAHLTQMKLCETFPDIPRDTLLDILATTDNNYNETVSILRSTMEINDTATMEPQIEDGLHQQSRNEYIQRRQLIGNKAWDDNENNDEASWSPEEAKRLALREFEEARNFAAHHCQLRAECFQKAKEAIQAGNGGAGIYYSQIANLHKQKIDMYNHRAANCIMDAHKYTQNNPDHLDLHYLHLLEALGCLDIFLDRHITALRAASRNYKLVFIITGRGKHSAGGVSVIKSKVKARLEERSLKWSEVNPGLLKVKVFSSSRHSQNF